nr:cytochrome P450 76C1-like [Tanacetum cinerariifolium]
MPSFPSPEPTVSYFDELDLFKDFEKEFPVVVYNDALTFKLDFLTEPTVSLQHIDEFDLKNETALSECDEEEQNILYFNDLFRFNVIYPDDSNSDKDNDDYEIDIKQSSRDSIKYECAGDVVNFRTWLGISIRDHNNKYYGFRWKLVKLEVSGNLTMNSSGDQRPTPANPNAKQYGPIARINLRIPPRPPGYAFLASIESNSIIAEECGSTDFLQMLLDPEGQKDGPRSLNKDQIKALLMECGSTDFLQMLLDPEGQKDGPRSLNKDQIKALLMRQTDATLTMVEWVMSEILNNPSVKRKVQDEPGEVIGVHMVKETHLPKLTYLDAVIKETFRSINVWAIHHDPQNWINPLEFKPKRFLKNKWDYNRNNLKFLPFGQS